MSKYPSVRITWLDGASHDAWQDVSELDVEPVVCITRGVLCRETETDIFVAGSERPDGQVSCVMQIPKRAILEKVVKGEIE